MAHRYYDLEETGQIKKGQWFVICCMEDLTQADEDFEFSAIHVFDTKEEAYSYFNETETV